eukprot:CAMPEP_0204834614 /NCGR_PEP_ID=MMETSP1346-20131115/20186_1 /ASSEMBLY_ACC=CAM_ASM_000771 /TAXON_ID=215587 /ORGANISM="Aplanochytrium stocchinoi, Strain GSBS06" /LENGTH=268 /DNA_ID=CAMNT_0051968009 /DNA_START=318 /DNA_END=1124 /DNA_ORIENTATION=+
MKNNSRLALNYLESDSTVWRYCLAHDYDIDAAESMFKHSIVWKEEEVKIHELYNEWRGEQFEIDSNRVAQQRNPSSNRSLLGESVFYGGILDAKSKNGGPVLLERLGTVDYSGLKHNKEAQDACFNSYIVYMEEAWRHLQEAGGKTRATYVIDSHGLSLSVIAHINFVKRITGLMVPNYPEVTEKVVIIRAPYFFNALWKLVQPFLPKRTRNKVSVFGSDYLTQLAKLVEGGVDSLPTFLGGNSDQHSICPTMKVKAALSIVESSTET